MLKPRCFTQDPVGFPLLTCLVVARIRGSIWTVNVWDCCLYWLLSFFSGSLASNQPIHGMFCYLHSTHGLTFSAWGLGRIRPPHVEFFDAGNEVWFLGSHKLGSWENWKSRRQRSRRKQKRPIQTLIVGSSDSSKALSASQTFSIVEWRSWKIDVS